MLLTKTLFFLIYIMHSHLSLQQFLAFVEKLHKKLREPQDFCIGLHI